MASGLTAALKRAKAQGGLILSPRVYSFLEENGDLVLSAENAQRLAEMVQRHPRERSGSFSPSGAGSCERRQVFNYLGTPQLGKLEPVKQNLFNDGTWRHLRWQMMGLEAGWFTDIEVKLPYLKYRSLGSADGANHDEGWLFELKGTSVSSKQLRTTVLGVIEEMEHGHVPPGGGYITQMGVKHVFQTHRYVLQSQGLFDRVVMMYEDKKTQDFTEIDYHVIPTVMRRVKRELDDLNFYVEQEKLPPVQAECAAGKGDVFKDCPYHHVCLGCGTWQSVPLPKTSKLMKEERHNA